MRAPSDIIERFLQGQMPQNHKIFTDATFASGRLSTAMKLLNIDEDKFERIPYKTDKVAFLQYKYMMTHCELFPDKFVPCIHEISGSVDTNDFKNSYILIRNNLIYVRPNGTHETVITADKINIFKETLVSLLIEEIIAEYQQPLSKEDARKLLILAGDNLHGKDQNKFKKIIMHSVDIKKNSKQLEETIHKYKITLSKENIRKLMSLNGKHTPPDYQNEVNEFKKLIKQTFDIINNSPLMTKHQDKYSKFAQGLSSLHQRSGKYTSKNMNLLDSVIQIGDKNGGIEPGFIAAHYQDLIDFLVKHCENNEDKILKFLIDAKGDINEIRERFAKELPSYMYKLDYQHAKGAPLITPGETPVDLKLEDVKRTSAVKEAYKICTLVGDAVAKGFTIAKSSKSGVINKEAVLETLSNDFASFFMRVQNQKLFKTYYENGDLKIMPYSEWVNGAEQFGTDTHPLIGGLKDHDNYRARTLLLLQNNFIAISDDRVMNMSRYYLPLLFTGDFDKVGSKGQNLLVVPGSLDEKTGRQTWELVGIDFGHTLREPNRLISQMLSDGRFVQPSSNIFKNFLALSDASLSEKMQGILILARLSGKEISPQIIDSYGEEFSRCYNRIEPNGGEILCNNYKDALEQLQVIDNTNHNLYQKLINEVEEFRKLMQADLKDYVKKFEGYLGHKAEVIDLVDNVNKFSAACLGKTTLRSNNGKVGLNHIAIKPEYTASWTLDFNAKNNMYTLKYKSNVKADINHLINNFKEKNEVKIEVNQQNALEMSFHKTQLATMKQLFSEPKIKSMFHKDDFDAIQLAKQEMALQDLIKAPWFVTNNISMDLILNSQNTAQFRIIVYAKNETVINQELADIIVNAFNLSFDESGAMNIDFLPEDLASISKKLVTIQNNYQELLEKRKLSQQPVIVMDKKVFDQSLIVSPVDRKLDSNKTALFIVSATPTSRGLSAGSSVWPGSLDPADKPQDVGVAETMNKATKTILMAESMILKPVEIIEEKKSEPVIVVTNKDAKKADEIPTIMTASKVGVDVPLSFFSQTLKPVNRIEMSDTTEKLDKKLVDALSKPVPVPIREIEMSEVACSAEAVKNILEQTLITREFYVMESKFDQALKALNTYFANRETSDENLNVSYSISNVFSWGTKVIKDNYNYYRNPNSSVVIINAIEKYFTPTNDLENSLESMLDLLKNRLDYLNKLVDKNQYALEISLLENTIDEGKARISTPFSI